MKESFAIKYDIVPYTRGRVLELGSDGFRMFPHFTTVDEGGTDEWKPDVVSELGKLSVFASHSMDAVFSAYVLHNMEDKAGAIKEWWRVIKQNGYLVLHFDGDLREEVIEIMKGSGNWDLVESRPVDVGFLQVYQKTGHRQAYSYADDKPEKTCAIFRHGGFGDMIMMSPILPVLKEQGYHITLYTSQSAYRVVSEDPHIDRFIIQDRGQIPNVELGTFWEYLSRKYTKFINLSESIEGALLALSGRMPFTWPKEAVHAYMNHNYDDFTHLVSGVPKKYEPKFYETEKERDKARRFRKKNKGRLIMWALAGSSVHKIYPWMDQVIARFMIETEDVKFVFVGDDACKIIEHPWRKERRVIRLSGEQSIRDTFALAKQCDVVIGPETGVMAAVGYEDVYKVVTMSHSTPEKLTKYWKNTISLEPEGCACYPCHRMVYGFDQCTRDEVTGVSKCQSMILPERVISAVKECLK